MAMESEDEDLNKCRDLVAPDDGCDLARRGETAPSKKSEATYERGTRERAKSNEKTTLDNGDETDAANTYVRGRSIEKVREKKTAATSPEIVRNCGGRRATSARRQRFRRVSRHREKARRAVDG